MKIFGFEFGKKEIKEETIVLNNSFNPVDSLAQFASFSIFDKSNENLSAPVVKEIYQSNGMVYFGTDNLEPNELVRLYYTSALNRSIIEFKKAMATAGGYYYENAPSTVDEKLTLYKWEHSFKLGQSYKEIAESLIIHSRVPILLTFDKDGKYLSATPIDPVKIRNGQKNIKGEFDEFFYSPDYTLSQTVQIIPAYKPGLKAEKQIYNFQYKSPGMDTYPLPAWVSAANEIYCSGELPYMRKSYMINSINPAFYLNFPRRLNEQGQNELKKSLSSGKGVKNNGKTLVFQSDSAEGMPTIGTIATSNNDKLFNGTYNQTNETICVAHSINPGIMGFKVNSSLGNGDELKTSYVIFKNTIISQLQTDIETIVNDIMFIANVTPKFKLSYLNIGLDEVITEIKNK